MAKKWSINRRFELVFGLATLIVLGANAFNLALYREADRLLYSGEVVWKMEYEAYQPIPPLKPENIPIGLTQAEYEAWKQKQQDFRKQSFQVHAYFQGDNLRFEYRSDAGDILPVKCDQTIAFNGACVTFIDNVLATLLRTPCDTSFRESHFSTFYIPPRACGYDGPHVLKMARHVKDRHGNEPEDLIQYEDTNDGNTIVLMGYFPESGQITLARLRPDSTFGQAFRSIQYIHPVFRHIVTIDCYDFKTYADGTVYPSKTMISNYLGDNIDNLNQAVMIDRITLTVVVAKLNQSIDDELFNPGCPAGYHNLQDTRRIFGNI